MWDSVARDLTDLGSARKLVNGLIAIETQDQRHQERMARQAGGLSSNEPLRTDEGLDDKQRQREEVCCCCCENIFF
jgi:hypothetical protein